MRALQIHHAAVARMQFANVINPPPSIAGLVMWLKADDLALSDGANANGVWPDASGNGNDMTLAGGPTYQTNEINGHAVVRFDNTDDSGSSGFSLSKPYTIFLLERNNGTASTRSINSDSINALIATGRTGVSCYIGGGLSTVSATGLHYACLVVPASGDMTFFVDGVDQTGSSIAALDWGLLNLGADGVFSEAADSDIAEVIVYDTALNSTDRGTVEHYLTSTYIP